MLLPVAASGAKAVDVSRHFTEILAVVGPNSRDGPRLSKTGGDRFLPGDCWRLRLRTSRLVQQCGTSFTYTEYVPAVLPCNVHLLMCLFKRVYTNYNNVPTTSR